MASPLTTTPESWVVGLEGRKVLMLTIDYRVTLHLHGETEYDGSVILESPFAVHAVGDPVIVKPEDKRTLMPVLDCFEKTVEAVSVSRSDGALTVTFTDGTVIEAASDAKYEAWEVNATGVKIVARPGGGEPALFSVLA